MLQQTDNPAALRAALTIVAHERDSLRARAIATEIEAAALRAEVARLRADQKEAPAE